MFNSWRHSRRPSNPSFERTSDATSPSPTRHDVGEGPNARPSVDHAVPGALSTPHDAILAELHGHPASPLHHPPADSQTASPMKRTVSTSAGSPERTDTASPSAALRSGTASPASAPEPVYDPFSGAVAGMMVPSAEPEPEQKGTSFDRTKDDLWAHLARIRGLQSAIATMHLQMENVGAAGEKRTAGGIGRMNTGTIRPTEEWEDPGEAEEQRRAARDAEFANLAEAFEGRRVAIDGIMDKLEDLSRALTTFHALPTPVMDFANSRSNTKDSFENSPDLYGSQPGGDTPRPEHPLFPDSPSSGAPSHAAFP
ncbi:hypothetical protein WOLCODRAFT_141847 [Wolfiporia cocos MD-104 SS10]|uniref:Uncharacterized protein n=1 Tax=Wolfiporia cocos (strain MD-104) TaxID=742152 RepID=A0A2H3JD45_WOLCO|nr:hypothetical protein WOLCODRAFT_141847 [Wolfiporia cocos MD-104 SS10]